jgi:hypothetical protein
MIDRQVAGIGSPRHLTAPPPCENSINRTGTAGRGAMVTTGSPHENRDWQYCNVTTYWCHAISPFADVRNSNDSTPGRIRCDLPYSEQKLIVAGSLAGCGNATMMSMQAGIHRLENIGTPPRCTNRLHAASTRLALQNYLLGLGHNRNAPMPSWRVCIEAARFERSQAGTL